MPFRAARNIVSSSAKLSALLSGMVSRSNAVAANLGALPLFLRGKILACAGGVTVMAVMVSVVMVMVMAVVI